ncbi:ATPase AAA [Planobispora longispora]|uniref:ATPase AAA n=2 Tax=Planobispora longispora TaxID=28887 RepID=A0A8J3W762_9ACTN|nr:ATP-binding protein [Planobispora longispora]GIH78497.1 ATPase AAA [Planobispora longispora]
MTTPTRLLARDVEWSTLTKFVAHPDPHLRLGVLSGRRRVGKSYLLRALADAMDGLYVSAVAEEGPVTARQRFAGDIARYAGVNAALFRADADWESLLDAAIGLTVQRRGVSGLLIIDELPYWMAHSPELPGLLQLLYDRSQTDHGHTGGRIILCGSAMSVMNNLLSGTKALRGRAVVDMRLRPFNLSTTAQHWEIDDPATALRLHATLGGSPGYRNLTSHPAPQNLQEFDTWISSTVLNPGQALFSRSEAEYLLREDPQFTGSSLHYAIINAVAAGATSPTKIGGLLERDRTSLSRPIEMLTSSGYLEQAADPLWKRRPVITVADPVIRFHNLITVPNRDLIETGASPQAWRESQPTFVSRILGPHFEECSREWLRRHATSSILGETRTIASTVINDRGGRAKHEIDVIALTPGSDRATVGLIGEAKATLVRRGPADLERLERLKTALHDQGHDVTGARLGLFSMEGFHPDLVTVARRRGDVLLVDLPSLFDQAEPPVLPG